MVYSYDRRVAADQGLSGLVQKYMSMLGLDVAPHVKVTNSIGAKQWGSCKWSPSQTTSTILIQKSAMADPHTLERVLAHEMAHHAVFLGNIRDLQQIVQDRGSRSEPYVREYLQDVRREDGHGAAWMDFAKVINQRMGSGFVSEKSDSTYVGSTEAKPYYVLIAKLPNGRFGFQIGVNLSSKMKRVVEVAGQRYEGKLVKTTDARWQHGPRIGDLNWATSPDKQQELQHLHESDRRVAAVRPEVAVHLDGSSAWIAVLDGDSFGVWKKPVVDAAEAEQELHALKRRIESGSADAVYDAGFAFDSDRRLVSPEFRALATEQTRRHQERDAAEVKALKAWFKGWVVEFVKDTYANYRARGHGKEPCVTASYVRGFILDGGSAPRDMTAIFKKLDNKKQLALCGYVLQQAKAQGKLQSSEGLDWNGRPAACYELA